MNTEVYGPQVPECDATHAEKHRMPNESFTESVDRNVAAMADDETHRKILKPIFLGQRYLAAGRIQAAMGSTRNVTAFNCFVSAVIEDSMESIMQRLAEAAETMRRGGGIGYDFSRIRPRRDRIVSLDSSASGPVSFMGLYDALCSTIMSAGHRRGAMMSVLRIDHPDIEEFIRAKRNEGSLTNFNISVGVTDEFMQAVAKDDTFDLRFDGRVYRTIAARTLWDEIMRSTWDWAEPGILFLDRINSDNPLYYCETIEATNPCGEQPLPPYGACLLGSFNLVKYVHNGKFNFDFLKYDIPHVVRAMDNVIDRTNYPLAEQELEAKTKRRMGIGFTGLANSLTLCDIRYGDDQAIRFTRKLTKTLCLSAYEASSDIAAEKGTFPAYDKDKYMANEFIQKFPDDLKEKIGTQGMRNSHMISIAPTGSISYGADNISSGMEPVFAHETVRTKLTEYGSVNVTLKDYVYNYHGIKAETTADLTVDDHLNMQIAVQPWVDSAVSKTINVSDDVTFDDFKDVYMKAWKGKLKGVTTFRAAGKRYGILNVAPTEEVVPVEGAACFFDPETGNKECS